MAEVIKLLLVDDHVLVRDVLAQRLDREPDLQVLATVGDAQAAVDAAIAHGPDIVLMDIDMPGLSCFEAADTIKRRLPRAAIVFLSAHVQDHCVEQALAVGAAGYLTKGMPLEEVVRAIHGVAGGGTCFSPDVLDRMVVGAQGEHRVQRPTARISTLTRRELEVLRYIARGLPRKEIARLLFLSDKTVHRHSVNLMKKLDIHDRVELARFAIREGLAEA